MPLCVIYCHFKPIDIHFTLFVDLYVNILLGFLLQVIHYDLPNSSEIFVHRSGRTGRAGKKGSAILVYTQGQSRAVQTIQRDVGCKFTEVIFASFPFPSFYLTGSCLCYYYSSHLLCKAEYPILLP